MHRIAYLIVRYRKAVIVAFAALAVACALLVPLVRVNYNMVDYLPPDAQSTRALALMTDDFDEALPNTNVMIRDVSLMDALSYKERLSALPGVSGVVWLDDMVDIKQPLEYLDAGTVEGFYKDGNALFSVTIAKGSEKETTAAIQDMIGPAGAVAGEAPDLAAMQNSTVSEVVGAMAILLPIILLLLIVSSRSWLEPLLFLLAIGVAIVINMGTNLIFGRISFMSNAIAPILQLACSLDYAIFLLHSFSDHRERLGDNERAMRRAIRDSMSTIAASALTTLFGFLALVFMNFRIGADLGWALAKGIVFSFLSSVVFLPAVTLGLVKVLDRWKHRQLMPEFKGVYRVVSKLAIPAIVVVVLLLVPSFLGQRRTEFLYGNESVNPTGRIGQDAVAIREAFGQNTVLALLVPRGDVAQEAALGREIEALDHVTGVMSYASTVDPTIPPEYLGEDITSRFYGEKYARIIAYTDTHSEGDEAFATVEAIQALARARYGDGAYSLGQSANLYDMKQVVATDNTMVNLIAVVAIFLVLLGTFRSATLPFILLITIETGIWINLSIPYFTGTPINFIGYLVLSTVQLGATVDYAILLTNSYLRARRENPKRDAMRIALGDSFKSILVSGATLATAGFTLAATSSNPGISDIGLLLGRGTLLSMAMVLCFLPAMLTMFDGAIRKTTYRVAFLEDAHKDDKRNEKEDSHEVQPG